MSSVYPSRSAIAVPTPPITPPKKSVVLADPDPQNVPADMNIPDNYVSHTLKTQKPLPPVDWRNWYNELNWLNVAILTLVPIIGIIGACFTTLRWETALFGVFYYYVTGLGVYPLVILF
jgi:stearoyl-CoA desaturase (Delta-9 desaturase)